MTAGDRSNGPARRRAWRVTAGAAGLTGSVACAASMILAALGVGGSAAATGMASMTDADGSRDALLGLLLRIGPWLLIISVVLVVAAFAHGARGRAAAIGALLAGARMYLGMYAQPNRALMYAAILAGYLTWAIPPHLGASRDLGAVSLLA